MSKLHVKKGDKVLVLTGKDKGKKGKILQVFPKKKRAIVEGINLMKKHTRPTQKSQQGGIVEREGTICISNVQIICPSCGAATRTGNREIDKGKVRVCKKCKQDIDK